MKFVIDFTLQTICLLATFVVGASTAAGTAMVSSCKYRKNHQEMYLQCMKDNAVLPSF
jgi:hypothetical protein